MSPKSGPRKNKEKAQKDTELKKYKVLSIDFYPAKMVRIT